MSDSPHSLSDDELVALIGASLAEDDPVPSHVLEAAKAVPDIAGLDAELAQLSFDSDLDLAGVRGVAAGTGRQLSFETDDIEIELVIHTEERTGRHVLVVEGQLVPAATGRVTLSSADPFADVMSTTADEIGRFRFDDVSAGAIRLLVHVAGGGVAARPVVTSWFRA